MIRVLLLDDEVDLREEVAQFLREKSYVVTEVGTIRQFYQYFHFDQFDVLILDRLLPDGDAIEIVKELRSKGSRIGIVMFTAKDATRDRIDGFESGADHYISKPVRLEELSGLIKVLSWRVTGPGSWRLSLANWTLSTPDNHAIHLTAQEYSFLSAIVQMGLNKTHSRESLLKKMGKNIEEYDVRNLDTVLLRLRKKIEEASGQQLPLKTVHAAGYSIASVVMVD